MICTRYRYEIVLTAVSVTGLP